MRITTLIWSLAAASFIATAGTASEKTAGETATKPALTAQTRCPVMGGKIDSTAFTDIQGQRVYHCCPGCTAKLMADPDKYFKQAAAEGVLFENIQTVCPVNGEMIDKSVMIDYEGRRVFFAGNDCRDKFLKEPARYLKILDQQTREGAGRKSDSKSATPEDSHGHH